MASLFGRNFSPPLPPPPPTHTHTEPPLKLLKIHELLYFQFIPCYLQVSKPCQGAEIMLLLHILEQLPYYRWGKVMVPMERGIQPTLITWAFPHNLGISQVFESKLGPLVII